MTTAENHIKKLIDSLETMTEYLAEAHEPDVNEDHGGDGPDGCSYCEAIEDASVTLKEAREYAAAAGVL